MSQTLTRRGRVVTIITALLAITPIVLTMQTARAGETQVYKWVDKDGTVSFSSQPPPSGHSESVTVKTTNPSQDTTAAPANNSNTDKKTTKKATKPKKKAVPQMSDEEKNRICELSRKDLADLQSHGRARTTDANGNLIYMSEQEKQQRMATDRDNIAKYCQ